MNELEKKELENQNNQEEEKKQEDIVENQNDDNEMDDDEFIESLLGKDDDELDEEEKRRKNKDAEEARKRREAKAKEKKEEEERKAKEEADKKAKEDAKAKEEEDKAKAKEEERADKVNTLGEQLVNFKTKHPDVDIAELDKDKAFKTFIDGKLLGKKDFTQLYEEYIEFRSDISGVGKEDVEKNFRKAQSSSGSSRQGSDNLQGEIYTQEEMKRIADRLPFMSQQEAEKVGEKLDKSIAYYEKN